MWAFRYERLKALLCVVLAIRRALHQQPLGGVKRLNKLRKAHGKSVLERLVVIEPGRLATIACRLLPRDVFINVGAWQSHLGASLVTCSRRPS
jgi:hypothetical protein